MRNNNFYQSFKKDRVIVLEKVFSTDDINNLDYITNPNRLKFSVASTGDTGEKGNLLFFRVKKTGEDAIYLPKVLQVLDKNKITEKISKIVGEEDLEIDRCQVHIYKKDGFAGRHNDKESVSSYMYTCILFLRDKLEYEGGEFVVYGEKENITLKPGSNAIIVADSRYDHSVNLIKSGERKAIVFFLQKKYEKNKEAA